MSEETKTFFQSVVRENPEKTAAELTKLLSQSFKSFVYDPSNGVTHTKVVQEPKKRGRGRVVLSV